MAIRFCLLEGNSEDDKLKFDADAEDINFRTVYVFWFVRKNTDQALPFYVGATDNLLRRMKDYRLGHDKAPTDFRVHTATKHLLKTKWEIVLTYEKVSEEEKRKQERQQIVAFLISGYHLLSSLPSYDYRQIGDAKYKNKIQRDIQKFCDLMCRNQNYQLSKSGAQSLFYHS
jgi:hypothetical protein